MDGTKSATTTISRSDRDKERNRQRQKRNKGNTLSNNTNEEDPSILSYGNYWDRCVCVCVCVRSRAPETNGQGK